MWDDDPSLLECLAYSLKWRVLSIFYYVQASMFVFVLCMPLVRILNWVFVLIEPLMLLVYVFIFSILLTILSGKKIVIFFYKLMLFFYSGYESSWFILSYYLLTYYWVFLLRNIFIMCILSFYNNSIFSYIFILFYYWFMLLFKVFYYIYFGPFWVKNLSFKEVFTLDIPSYFVAQQSLMSFFSTEQLEQPSLLRIYDDFSVFSIRYKKDLSHIVRLKSYNFLTSYCLPVWNFYLLKYTFIFNTILNVFTIRFFFFN
jgi:hypothetical protein